MTVSVPAYAKVNPTLRVLGRRTDGFHELVTTMLALDLADRVSVSRGGAPGMVRVDVDGAFATPDVPRDASNLAARGALAVRSAAKRDDGLAISIEKSIPSRAGLGGGSADAAAAAEATSELLGVDERALLPLLAEIGSDCAFFHAARSSGAAVAFGRGDDVRTLQRVPDWTVAIVTPDVACSTPAVYGALGLETGRFDPFDVEEELARGDALFALPAVEARERLVNDLEPAARSAVRELAPWRDVLASAGHAHFMLSGSGASYFGLFDDRPDAEDALRSIERVASGRGLALRFRGVARPAGERERSR
ncbi:MAG: 4-(cytidine 5'-diphospho)-2-C-methyl-D-erythritol kinase [Planctomycetota bacterium]